jgi:hypothetical protein
MACHRSPRTLAYARGHRVVDLAVGLDLPTRVALGSAEVDAPLLQLVRITSRNDDTARRSLVVAASVSEAQETSRSGDRRTVSAPPSMGICPDGLFLVSSRN